MRKKGPYSELFSSAFGLNAERYEVSLHIQSECGKMWTRVTPNMDTFYAVILKRFLFGQKTLRYVVLKWLAWLI